MRALLLPLLVLVASPAQAAKVNVVVTLSDYGWAARAVGGDAARVSVVCPPDQDAHFLAPRPSYARLVAEADLFVATGLDLEVWAPVLLQKAANAKVMPGAAGYVRAAESVHLLDVPAVVDRSQGDVHAQGNPHLHTSPVNMRRVLRNIAAGLSRVDPARATEYAARAKAAVADLDARVFGAELVRLVGGDTLAALAEKGRLHGFLAEKRYKDAPLTDRLGGWLGAGRTLRDAPLVTWHPNWTYLRHLLGLRLVGTVEPKPGVQPTPGHVRTLTAAARTSGAKRLLAASHFPAGRVREIAGRLGLEPSSVPFHTGDAGYPALVDAWLAALLGR